MTECRPGAVNELGALLADAAPNAVSLFTGGDSYRRSGAAAVLEPLLATRTFERIVVRPNPTLTDLTDAIERLRGLRPDLVVAVGGGSVLDLAKAARGLVGEEDVLAAVLAGSIDGEPVAPLVAIPTTAGSGSEATHFSAIYVDGVKHSVGGRRFRPEHVLLDPGLTASLPPRQTAATGLDALAQAIESTWSVRSTGESVGHARRALTLAWRSLEDAVHDPSPSSRTDMCSAAHLAGKAIDVSRTTAAHALSYSMTARHGIAHGHAVGLTLGALLEHNAGVTDSDCADPRGARLVRDRIADVLAVLGVADGPGGRRALTQLIERIGLEPTLGAAGVTRRDDRRAIVESVDAERLANNPRRLDEVALTWIVESSA